MEIRKIPIEKINPAPYNPRVDLAPGDQEYEKLKKSIESFGYVEPLVWNARNGTLISGHQRYKILRQQGIGEVEVSVVDLPDDREKALNLALNKIRGDWDQDKLAVLLDEMIKMPEFPMELTGFDLPEISSILDASTNQYEDNFDFDAAVPETPITQKGDLVHLGPHCILCGDSFSAEDVSRLLNGQKVNLINTDPPYNVNYYGGNRPTGSARPKNSKLWAHIYSDNLSQDEYETWLKKVLTNGISHLEQGAAIYIWNGHKQFGPMHLMLRELGVHISSVITWAKPNFAIGYGDYNQQTEFALYGWLENNGSHIWYGPTNESTLWNIKRDPTKSYIHSTQKPLALAQRAIRNSSKRKDLVLDMFLGSGSTLIAAESLERRCFGMEIDPRYVDGIVRRYMAFVGLDKVTEELKARYLVPEKVS
jgi:DNA modification methylase